MNKLTYSDKLQNPLWQKKRLLVLARDNWQCQLCKDAQTTLHVHHNLYTGNPWDAPDENLQTLCKHCHEIVETLKAEGIDTVIIERTRNKTDGSKALIAIYTSKSNFEKYAVVYSVDSAGVHEIIRISETNIDIIKALMNK